MKKTALGIPKNIKLYRNLVMILCFCIFFFSTNKLMATVYYVSTNGSNSDSGLSEALAWETITYAATQAGAGDTVYIKAGNYGNENVIISNSGTASSPISFIGYKTTINDISGNDYNLGDTLDSTEMPLLSGSNRATGKAFDLATNYNDYITIKNIQIQNYSIGIYAYNSTGCCIENIIALNFGDPVTTAYVGYGISFGASVLSASQDNILKNSIVVNACAQGISYSGNYNLIENCQAYCNEGNYTHDSMDYYIIIKGNYNTVNNCYTEAVGNGLNHWGHGIQIKGDIWDCEYNTIQNCIAVANGNGFELRVGDVKNNIVKDCTAIDNDYSGFLISDGANNNLIINSCSSGARYGFAAYDNGECSDDGGYAALDNTFQNCIFSDSESCIAFDWYDRYNSTHSSHYVANTKFINCTFYDADELFDNRRNNSGTEFINCIISDVTSEYTGSSVSYTATYSNFYNGFTAPSGTGNISSDPKFVDIVNGDFRLKSDSPCIDAGTSVNLCFDYNYINRPYSSSHDIGAHEYVIKNALVHLKMDENTSSTTEDAMGNVSDGTIYNATWTTGKLNKALDFDGSGDYVNFGTQSELELTGSRTICAWIYPEQNDYFNVIASKYRWGYALYTFNGKLSGFINGSTSVDSESISSTALTVNNWYHVAMTYDNDGNKKIRLYVNGDEVSYGTQTAMTGTLSSNSTRDFSIGSDLGTRYWFNGAIDNVKVFTKELCSKDIFDEYASVLSVELDEGAGSNAEDHIHGNDGTISGAEWIKGISGKALDFDGSNDDIDFGNPAILELSGSRSISAWIKPESNGYLNVIASKYMWGYSLSTHNGKLRGYIDGTTVNADSISTESIPIGVWTHVAMTFDVDGDKRIYLYINGEEASSTQTAMSGSPASTSTRDFTIGSDLGTRYWFDGLIDKVKVFNIALSAQEVLNDYNFATVFDVDIDENTGSSVNDDANGNDGTISGASWTTGKSGSALNFDGTNDDVDFGNPQELNLHGSRTISAWIYPDVNGAYNVIAAKGIWGYSLFTSSGKLRGHVDGSGTDDASSTSDYYNKVSTGTWNHVAMTFDVNGYKKIHLYINGEEVDGYDSQTAMTGNPVSTSSYDFTIGSNNGGSYWFDGKIDEVRVDNRALTADEIDAIYQSY